MDRFRASQFFFLWYGVSRTVTHELVRHRAGMGFSQLSQRYVSGKVLRFVERPEYQGNQKLHQKFEDRIDKAATEYESVAQELLSEQKLEDRYCLQILRRIYVRKSNRQRDQSCLEKLKQPSCLLAMCEH